MANLDEFKSFIKTIPDIRNEVLNGRYTWQQLYEIYTLYGKDDVVFKGYVNHKNSNEGLDLQKIMLILKNLDLDALSRSLDGISKLLNVVIGLSDKTDHDVTSFYKGDKS